MEIRRSASTVSRARGPRLCRRTWEWWFKVRGHSGGSVIREEPPFIWLHLWFSWRQPFDNAAEHVPASIREFTVCVPDPGKTPPISLKRTHQENFFKKQFAKRFLWSSRYKDPENEISKRKEKTPLFSTTHRQFSRNPEIGANYSQIAYDIHLYRKKEKKKRENYEGNITILHRFQPFTFLTHATSFPTNFSRAKKSQRRKKENIRVTILTASLPYFK